MGLTEVKFIENFQIILVDGWAASAMHPLHVP
jgi:hypothetical protein